LNEVLTVTHGLFRVKLESHEPEFRKLVEVENTWVAQLTGLLLHYASQCASSLSFFQNNYQGG
jgi:hypothetical protein